MRARDIVVVLSPPNICGSRVWCVLYISCMTGLKRASMRIVSVISTFLISLSALLCCWHISCSLIYVVGVKSGRRAHQIDFV